MGGRTTMKAMGTDDTDRANHPGITPYFRGSEFPPPSATVHATFGARTSRGRSHDVNGDHYVVIRLGRSQETVLTSIPDGLITKRFDEHGFALVVADGLGDFASGEA